MGISHCSVFQNPDTKEWFYASQGRLPPDVPGIVASNAVMMGQIRQISWTEDGWPVVAPERYAAVPNEKIGEKAVIGTYEQITLEYQYRVMQKPVTVVLFSNHSVSGGVYGTWSLDSVKNVLTINSNKFNVANAWNWEAATRKRTITYAGLSPIGRSVWAKKVN